MTELKASTRRIAVRGSAIAVALSLVALTLVAGCGSDDGPTTSNGSAATEAQDAGPDQDTGSNPKVQFVTEVSAICRQNSKQIQTKLQPLLAGEEGPNQPAAVAAAIVNDVIVPGVEREISALRALKPPENSNGQIDAVLLAMQRELNRAQENPLKFAENGQPFAKSEKVADKQGLKACGGI